MHIAFNEHSHFVTEWGRKPWTSHLLGSAVSIAAYKMLARSRLKELMTDLQRAFPLTGLQGKSGLPCY